MLSDDFVKAELEDAFEQGGMFGEQDEFPFDDEDVERIREIAEDNILSDDGILNVILSAIDSAGNDVYNSCYKQ